MNYELFKFITWNFWWYTQSSDRNISDDCVFQRKFQEMDFKCICNKKILFTLKKNDATHSSNHSLLLSIIVQDYINLNMIQDYIVLVISHNHFHLLDLCKQYLHFIRGWVYQKGFLKTPMTKKKKNKLESKSRMQEFWIYLINNRYIVLKNKKRGYCAYLISLARSIHLSVVATEKGAFESPSTTVANFFFYIIKWENLNWT